MSDKVESMPETPVVTFTYLKSNAYRSLKIDGMVGGPTPRGDIAMSIFSERTPLPSVQTYEVSEEKGLRIKSQELEVSGMIRDVEATILLRPETAAGVINWLVDQLRLVEDHSEFRVELKANGKIDLIPKEGKSDG